MSSTPFHVFEGEMEPSLQSRTGSGDSEISELETRSGTLTFQTEGGRPYLPESSVGFLKGQLGEVKLNRTTVVMSLGRIIRYLVGPLLPGNPDVTLSLLSQL